MVTRWPARPPLPKRSKTLHKRRIHTIPKEDPHYPQLMQLSGLEMKPGSTEDRSGKRVKVVVSGDERAIRGDDEKRTGASVFIEKAQEMETNVRYNSRNTIADRSSF